MPWLLHSTSRHPVKQLDSCYWPRYPSVSSNLAATRVSHTPTYTYRGSIEADIWKSYIIISEIRPWTQFIPAIQPWTQFISAIRPWTPFIPAIRPWTQVIPAIRPWTQVIPAIRPCSQITPHSCQLSSTIFTLLATGCFEKILNS